MLPLEVASLAPEPMLTEPPAPTVEEPPNIMEISVEVLGIIGMDFSGRVVVVWMLLIV